jgi:hypothetical protein
MDDKPCNERDDMANEITDRLDKIIDCLTGKHANYGPQISKMEDALFRIIKASAEGAKCGYVSDFRKVLQEIEKIALNGLKKTR